MALAKHHEEVLHKILDNFASLKSDADLNQLLVDNSLRWNPREAKFDKAPTDPKAEEYDANRICLNLIKNLHTANLHKDAIIERLKESIAEQQQLVARMEAKLKQSRQAMKKEYRAKIAELKMQITGSSRR